MCHSTRHALPRFPSAPGARARPASPPPAYLTHASALPPLSALRWPSLWPAARLPPSPPAPTSPPCVLPARPAPAEPAADAGGPGGQLGPRHPAHQHPLPEGPAHAGVRQGLARAPGAPPRPARPGLAWLGWPGLLWAAETPTGISTLQHPGLSQSAGCAVPWGTARAGLPLAPGLPPSLLPAAPRPAPSPLCRTSSSTRWPR